jgi:uncharacterized protein YndB with AHSA1/START domain/DNA-binding HxlR family transcriptional regulator
MRSGTLDAIFAALADPTRRAILARLASSEASVTELAEPFAMSQPAISKHLRVLERAGLISRGRDAQRRPRRIEGKWLAEADEWLERYRPLCGAQRRAPRPLAGRTEREVRSQRPKRPTKPEVTNRETNVTRPSDREIAVTRLFDAPRQRVFEAFNQPELVKRWLYGSDEWPLVHCAIDLKVGGALRYVWRHPERGEAGMSGVFREVAPPKRIVNTELFDQDWTSGETVVTTVFAERGRRTIVTATVLYSSQEARDGALKTGMIEGWSKGYDRLAELLVELRAAPG